MTIVGEWTLYFDWRHGGTYYPASICFNSDGTFSHTAAIASKAWGRWVQVDSILMWQFALSSGLNGYIAATYSGSKVGNVMIGVMIYGNPSRIYKGRWYAIKKGTNLYNGKEGKPESDFAGKKINTKKRRNVRKTIEG